VRSSIRTGSGALDLFWRDGAWIVEEEGGSVVEVEEETDFEVLLEVVDDDVVGGGDDGIKEKDLLLVGALSSRAVITGYDGASGMKEG
jgi:hypothetical protein